MGANRLSNGNGVSVQSYPEWELSASRLGACNGAHGVGEDLVVALGFLPRHKGPVTIPASFSKRKKKKERKIPVESSLVDQP